MTKENPANPMIDLICETTGNLSVARVAVAKRKFGKARSHLLAARTKLDAAIAACPESDVAPPALTPELPQRREKMHFDAPKDPPKEALPSK